MSGLPESNLEYTGKNKRRVHCHEREMQGEMHNQSHVSVQSHVSQRRNFYCVMTKMCIRKIRYHVRKSRLSFTFADLNDVPDTTETTNECACRISMLAIRSLFFEVTRIGRFITQ